jgi:lipopolysaccharide export system permease protein
VVAKVALLLGSGSQVTLRLIDGGVYSVEPNGSSFHRTDFNVYDLKINLDTALVSQERQLKPHELKLNALMTRITTKQTSGEPTFQERVELHRRFALPFSCLIFAIASICLGLCNSKITRPRAAVTALGIIALYYISYAVGQSVAAKGFLPAWVGAWLPNILVAIVEILIWISRRDGRAPFLQRS